MDISTFESALAAKLSRELDTPSNWENGSLTSIQHKDKSKDYVLYLSSYFRSTTMISPHRYEFNDKILSEMLYHKAMNIYNYNATFDKQKREDETRKKIIEDLGLENRATKLRKLAEISLSMPDIQDTKIENIEKIEKTEKPEEPEIELILPKKNKFWNIFK